MDGRGERIRTSGLYVPNVALYLTKLHPDGVVLALHADVASAATIQQLGRQF